MRRCSAPSQLQQASKRPRFNPPVCRPFPENPQYAALPPPSGHRTEAATSLPLLELPLSENKQQERSARDILHLINTKKDVLHENPGSSLQQEEDVGFDFSNGNSSQHSGRYVEDVQPSVLELPQSSEEESHLYGIKPKTMKQQMTAPHCEQNMYHTAAINRNRLQNSGDEEPQKKYYSVMWCKNSARKHKKWEGDAVLVTRGRSVKLLDMDGKEIGQGTGYKTAELQSLVDGSTLVIGGKMIEVMNAMSEKEFLSGQCFQGSAAAIVNPEPSRPKPVANKPFVKPMKQGTIQMMGHAAKPPASDKPMFNPDSPGALVMPRPSQAHQWEHNKNKLPVTDVVVDPHISRHLRPHQRDGVLFLYHCVMGMRNYSSLGAILADEMGLGKTLQCIALLWTLFKQGPYGGKPIIRRVLVITPGSLVKNWAREFQKWLGSERLQVYAVSPDKKVEEFVKMTTCPVLIISYEMFVRSINIIQSVNFDLVVCDEGHRLKNSNIKTTSCVSSLNVKRRVVLTGTPVQNDLQELYSLVDFCNPGILGSLSAFQNVYEKAITEGRDTAATRAMRSLGERRAAELNRITSLFILRRTQDINQQYLPPKVEVVLFCQPSKLQLELYRCLLQSRLFTSCIRQAVDAGQHLMCISALKKLCNHPVLIYSEAHSQHHAASADNDEQQLYSGLAELYPVSFDPSLPSTHDSGKFAVLATLLRAMHSATPRQRVVLVSNYTQTLYLFEELCKHEGYTFLRLDGQTPTAKRQQLVETFNSPYSQHFVFLLSSKAGGVGLNLIGASRLILYDVDWNPANDLQAMARVWRDGQRQKVYVYRLLTTGSVEEKMYQRQVSKTGLSGVVVDAKMDNKLHFSPADLKDIFSLQENTLCATHDLLQCACGGDPCWEMDKLEDPDAPVSRPCQLQPVALTKQRASNKVCMSELMEWKHVTGPAPDLNSVDPVVCNEDLQSVTYAFWNEMQATR